MEQAEIRQKVRSYIAENFLYMRPDKALGDQESLLGNGIVDSMGVMEVMMFLEEEFGVVVEDNDITEANLGTLEAIARYVASHQDAGAQAS
jgi:acyl carrier protein